MNKVSWADGVWRGPYECGNLWACSYHIPHPLSGRLVIIRVFGDTKDDVLQRELEISKSLKLKYAKKSSS